jgi:hypothetical protein
MKLLTRKLEIRRKTKIFLIPFLGALSVEYSVNVSNTPMAIKDGRITPVPLERPEVIYALGVSLTFLLIAGTCWLTSI